MTKKEDQAPISSEEPKNNEATQSSAATAVAEKPKEHQWQDDDEVTVLYGWGKVHPNSRSFIDKTLFEGGVARNVPYEVVKHWIKGTRPDGKREQVYGKVKIQAVLPADAKEADFAKATGITPTPIDQFAMQLAGTDLDALVAQLGVKKVKELIKGLDERLPEHARR